MNEKYFQNFKFLYLKLTRNLDFQHKFQNLVKCSSNLNNQKVPELCEMESSRTNSKFQKNRSRTTFK